MALQKVCQQKCLEHPKKSLPWTLLVTHQLLLWQDRFYLLVATILVVLCLQDCIYNILFHLLLWFLEKMLQGRDPTCLKFPWKTLLLPTDGMHRGESLLHFHYSVRIVWAEPAEMFVVLAVISDVNCWSSSVKAWRRLIFSLWTDMDALLLWAWSLVLSHLFFKWDPFVNCWFLWGILPMNFS